MNMGKIGCGCSDKSDANIGYKYIGRVKNCEVI